jgi:serine dehydratase beta subunit
MYSIRELYRMGRGPSSSHTMGPANAAALFQRRFPQAQVFRIHLFGSLAATGRGHLTDTAVQRSFAPWMLAFSGSQNISLPFTLTACLWKPSIPRDRLSAIGKCLALVVGRCLKVRPLDGFCSPSPHTMMQV